MKRSRDRAAPDVVRVRACESAILGTLIGAGLVGCVATAPMPQRHVAKMARTEYQGFLKSIDAIRDDAIRRASAAMGVEPPSVEIPILVTSGSAPGDPGKCGRFYGQHAIAKFRSWARRGVVVRMQVVLCLDRMLQTALHPEAVLRHEIAHMVMRKALGAYTRNAPHWFSEGVAELLSGGGGDRVAQRLAWRWRARPTSLAALSGDSALRGRYSEAYLHVKALLKHGGANALARMISILQRGAPFWVAVQEVTGLGQAAYVAASDALVGDAFSAFQRSPGFGELRAAVRGVRSDTEAAVARLRRLLADPKAAALHNRARYQLAGALLRIRQPVEALAQLERCLAEGQDHGRVLARYARALLANRRIDDARAIWAELAASKSGSPKRRASARRALERLNRAPRDSRP